MKILSNHRATPEQLPIVSRNTPGIVVIRGAAGSGKKLQVHYFDLQQ